MTVEAGAEVSLWGMIADHLAQTARHAEAEAARQEALTRAVQPVLVPAVQFTITANQVVGTVQQSQLGPEDGQVWDVRRVSLFGLGTSDQIGVYRQAAGAAGQPQNFLQVLTATAPTWNPSGGLLLRAPDQLALAAYSATLAATGVTLNCEAIAVDARYLAGYLY